MNDLEMKPAMFDEEFFNRIRAEERIPSGIDGISLIYERYRAFGFGHLTLTETQQDWQKSEVVSTISGLCSKYAYYLDLFVWYYIKEQLGCTSFLELCHDSFGGLIAHVDDKSILIVEEGLWGVVNEIGIEQFLHYLMNISAMYNKGVANAEEAFAFLSFQGDAIIDYTEDVREEMVS